MAHLFIFKNLTPFLSSSFPFIIFSFRPNGCYSIILLLIIINKVFLR